MKDGGAGEFRRSIGADILEAMKASSDLPLPNVQRLAIDIEWRDTNHLYGHVDVSVNR